MYVNPNNPNGSQYLILLQLRLFVQVQPKRRPFLWNEAIWAFGQTCNHTMVRPEFEKGNAGNW